VTDFSSPEPFRITQSLREDGTAVLTVYGDVDLATAGELEAALDARATHRSAVVLHLGAVAFMDSSGLRVIIDATRVSRRDGWSFAIAAEISAPVARLFDIAGMRPLLPLESSPERPAAS
jgi:anti-anti-sigma factor